MDDSKLQLENYSHGANFTAPPVQIRELLQSISNAELPRISGSFSTDSNSGWMWLIYGRTCYAWNYRHDALKCYEFLLPPSGLTYHSRLFYVLPVETESDSPRLPSCLCVSPEGTVRFWPKFSQPSIYVDITLELNGEVAHLLARIKAKATSASLLLATTTCSLYMLSAPDRKTSRDQPIVCTPLRMPQSLVSGIGRRVSLLIFANSSSLASQETLVNVAVTSSRSSVTQIYALNAKCQLTFWRVEKDGNYKFLWENDMAKIFVDKLCDFWNLKGIASQIKIWPVDFVSGPHRKLAILMAVMNQSLSMDVSYTIMTFDEHEDPPKRCRHVYALPFRKEYKNRMEDEENRLRLIWSGAHDGFFICDVANLWFLSETRRTVISSSISRSDFISGAELCGGQLLVFSTENGLQRVKLSSAGSDVASSLVGDSFKLQQTLKSEDELETMAQADDRLKNVEAAFDYYLKECENTSEEILHDLFEGDDALNCDDLDSLVAELALVLVDNFPASDPRWKHALGDEITGRRSRTRQPEISGSLLLLYQLEDKRQTMNAYLSFLRWMPYSSQIDKVFLPDGRRIPTVAFVCELMEKLEACSALAQKLDGSPKPVKNIVRDAIALVLKDREETIKESLGAQDVFFRRVSRFDEFLPALVSATLDTTEKAKPTFDSRLKQDLLLNVGELLLIMLHYVIKCRRRLRQTLDTHMPVYSKTWLNTDNLINALNHHYRKVSELLPEAVDKQIAGRFAQQLCELADLLISEIMTSHDKKSIEQTLRHRLIVPLIKNGYYDNAIFLAEKNRDYLSLIEICENSGNDELLNRYKMKYKDDHFNELLFDYYMQNGQIAKIFNDAFTELHEKIAYEFFESQERPDMTWILSTKTHRFEEATAELCKMAHAERSSIEKQKTLFSLAKLSALAADTDPPLDTINTINDQLILTAHQERLPSSGGQPLNAKELIEAYISDPKADEWSFGRAADLLVSVRTTQLTEKEFVTMKNRIWAKAVLMDNWDEILTNTDDLLAASEDTMLCRTLKLLRRINCENRQRLRIQLPVASSLLQQEYVGDLAGNPKLQYIVKAAEEKLSLWIQNSDSDSTVCDEMSMMVDD